MIVATRVQPTRLWWPYSLAFLMTSVDENSLQRVPTCFLQEVCNHLCEDLVITERYKKYNRSNFRSVRGRKAPLSIPTCSDR
jgi:hypothetical protein